MNYTISLIYASIFNGTEVLVPCLVILNALKIQLADINRQALIYAVNSILLLGSILFTISLLSELFMAYYSQSEYLQFSFSNRLAGPFWLYIWLTGVLSFMILPQILWIRKLRRSLISSIVIVGIWIALYFVKQVLIAYQAWHTELKPSYSEYAIQAIIYLTFLFVAYLLIHQSNNRLYTTKLD
ncbi:hypothetical protein [Mucilaginibacter celer]|uniref:Uncharacterized protein n=1 Tax=Mucilaginibacter celer TaxID=2305508 RepID=A0A494VPX9_9SPHI|nr:hypothetical protein [Mucilaginibacter celer]AYL97537.1 hypothetical protein HYN43_020535 [Mucilaginibacter celer]